MIIVLAISRFIYKTVLKEGPDHTPKGSWKFWLIYNNFVVGSNSSSYPPSPENTKIIEPLKFSYILASNVKL